MRPLLDNTHGVLKNNSENCTKQARLASGDFCFSGGDGILGGMKFSAPQDLGRFEVSFDHSEINAHFPAELREFVGNIGFPMVPSSRPWVYANFVQSIDGLVSFGGNYPGGE